MNEQEHKQTVSEMLANLTVSYPKEIIEETARAAFAEVMGHLYAQGGEIKALAEVADMAFMVFDLAQEEAPSTMNVMTLNEYMPTLVSVSKK